MTKGRKEWTLRVYAGTVEVWIPAYAGMTWGVAGMMWIPAYAGMTWGRME